MTVESIKLLAIAYLRFGITLALFLRAQWLKAKVGSKGEMAVVATCNKSFPRSAFNSSTQLSRDGCGCDAQ
jgi:hypothetical protein